MWSGRQTLQSIESAISRLNAEESQLDTALRQGAANAERLRHDRMETFRELARVKLDEMAAGRLVRDLDAAERRAAQLLEQQRLELAATADQRIRTVAEVEAAERERNEAAAKVEAALEAVAAIRAETETKLQILPEWQAGKRDVDAAEAIAGEADKKARQSENELGEKRKPYDGDPLFIYLWQRGWGTQRYVAGNLTRWIDGMVASFVGYAEARPNYHMLIEIPLRLREHAKARRASADERKSALADVERRAMVAAGVEPRERALAEARHALAAADANAERKSGNLKAIDDKRSKLLGKGKGDAYQAALETIASADSKDDLATLVREARRTPTPADDQLVNRIAVIDEQIGRADGELAELRRAAQDLAKRRLEVERVRDRFRGAGYDHPDTIFGNDQQIARTLEDLVRGVIRSGILWDLLRGGIEYKMRQRGRRIGGAQFPFPFPLPGGGGDGPRGGEWREPGSSGGWTPSGGGGGGDSGDFKTGGEF